MQHHEQRLRERQRVVTASIVKTLSERSDLDDDLAVQIGEGLGITRLIDGFWPDGDEMNGRARRINRVLKLIDSGTPVEWAIEWVRGNT